MTLLTLYNNTMNSSEKIVLITGATSGIGKVTALELAKRGMHLVLPVRNMDKGKKTAEEIKSLTSNNNIHLYYCDLESLESVKNFAEHFLKDFSNLHILINNAGVWFSKREVTIDGFEKNFAINHLAHFLLTNMLLETLKSTKNSRIISVSSEAHRFATINFNDIQGEKSFNSFKAYGQSKLANIFFVRKLADILEGTSTTANCLHPGIVSTQLFNKMGGIMKNIFGLFMIPPEKGAQTSIFLATSEEVNNVSGGYFRNKKLSKSTPYSYNMEIADKLWKVSMELTSGALK